MPSVGGPGGLADRKAVEYAARAGSRKAYPWGDEPDDRRANWYGQQGGTTPVGQFPPNAFGLFDMHGNVWEWSADPWRERLDEPVPQEPEGPSRRAVRGGSWFHLPGLARSAYRFDGRPGHRHRSQGFRLALRSSSPDQSGARQGRVLGFDRPGTGRFRVFGVGQ